MVDECLEDQNLNLSWKETAKTSGSAGRQSYGKIQQMKRYWMLVSPQTKAAVNLAAEERTDGSTVGRAIVAPSRTTSVMTKDTKRRLHWAFRLYV